MTIFRINKDNKVLRKIIHEGNITEAFNVINKLFPTLLKENTSLLKMLHVQQFIEYIKSKDHVKAIEYAQTHLNTFQNDMVTTINSKGQIQESIIDVTIYKFPNFINIYELKSILALFCYPDPETSELKHLLSFGQRDLTADLVNREILCKSDFILKLMQIQ